VRDASPGSVEADTLIVVGHARLPQSLSPADAASVLVELEVRREDGVIVNAYFSAALPGAARLLASLLAGKSIDRDFDAARREFQRRYVGPPQRAIATALAGACESYERHRRQSGLGAYFSHRMRPPDERLR
jgi:hypothetical protein